MKHKTRIHLLTIPSLTLLATLGLSGCDQPQQPTVETMNAPEQPAGDAVTAPAVPAVPAAPDQEGTTARDAPNQEGTLTPEEPYQESTMEPQGGATEEQEPANQSRTSSESNDLGQVRENDSDYYRVVFRATESGGTSNSWTRLSSLATQSQ